METKKKTVRKLRAKKPTDSVRFLPGSEPNWFHYPPEWDIQSQKLQEEWNKQL